MSKPMVDLSQVNLTLAGGGGPVNILRDVDLSLAPGEAAAITGPSGSGKTSLLMTIAGLEPATSGSVRVDSTELAGMNEDQLARFRLGRVGIVFQAFHLLGTLTAAENVALPLELLGHADAQEQAQEWLAAVELGGRADHFPSELSGGEQQRVALARAFAPKPALILADEPTGNLDDNTGDTVMDLLFSLCSDNRSTLLMVTHDKGLAQRCPTQLVMHQGKLERI